MAAATAPTSSFRIRGSFHYSGNVKKPFRKVGVKASQMITASLRARRPQNVSGEFFVDHTCIDCDTCRWMAPENFARAGDMSAVYKQPSCEEERLRALQALLSCPTSSIHTEKPSHDILEVQKTFPIPIDEHTLPGVYHCGFHSEKSFGAASYLILCAEGNILVDSPRYTRKLENNLKMLGGARYMFLTHSDDVADHEKWSNHLGCERILHSAEGSVCLLYKPCKVLFTGDHFAMSELGLTIYERYNKFSVPKQLNSVKMMLDLDFEWILPGHGRRTKFRDLEDKNSSLRAFLQTKMQLL
ncbi:unnamed protein product [Withania somnifera]